MKGFVGIIEGNARFFCITKRDPGLKKFIFENFVQMGGAETAALFV